MLRRRRASFILAWTVSSALLPCLAAENPSDFTTHLLKRATSITSELNGNRQSPCPSNIEFCPRFFDELIKEDKEDGYLVSWPLHVGHLLDGGFKNCMQRMNPVSGYRGMSFTDPNQLQNYIQSSEFSGLGTQIHQTIRNCASRGLTEDFNRIGKYYFSLGRLDSGIQKAQNEISRMNTLLEDEKSVGSCNSLFESANTQCKALNACPSRPEALSQVVMQSYEDEPKYQKATDELKKLSKCLSDREIFEKDREEIRRNGHKEHCDSLASLDGIHNQNCRSLTTKDLEQFEKCQIQAEDQLKTLALLEKVNPWFGDEDFWKGRKKVESMKLLISNSLKKTRSTLKKAVTDFNEAGLCLVGTATKKCSREKFREILDQTPRLILPAQSSQQHQDFKAMMEAQSCIEEGSNDRIKTMSTLRTSTRDAALALFTAGTGPLTLKAALWLGRGEKAAVIAKSTSQATSLAIDGFYFSDSAILAMNKCVEDFDRQMVDLHSSSAEEGTCPNPLAAKMAAQSAGDSCKASAFETALNALPLAPALAKKARPAIENATPSGWVDRRTSGLQKEKKQSGAHGPSRDKLIRENLNTEFTTEFENAQWIKFAKQRKPDGKTIFAETENSVIQELNTRTQDKDLVTALTHKHKSFLRDEIKNFSSKHPDIEIINYSDFKATRMALRPKPPATKIPPGIEAELRDLFQRTNDKYVDFLVDNNLIRDADQPENWFRSGFGETADRASLASRYSRSAEGPNRMRSFSEPGLQQWMGAQLKEAEMLRSDLQVGLGSSGLMSAVTGSEKKTLDAKVFNAIKKSPTSDDLIENIKKSSGVTINQEQAVLLQNYFTAVNSFSPSIYIEKRKIASLSDSIFGGFNLDFAGMGAKNARANAEALVHSKNLAETVEQTRMFETAVTEKFVSAKSAVAETIDKIMKKNGIEVQIIDSGDDMVVKPINKIIPDKVKAQVTEALAKEMDPSSMRMSHAPAGVAKEMDRSRLGTQGEDIEKSTRRILLDKGLIESTKMDNLLLLVDMKGSATGEGAVQLFTGRATPLTVSERRSIQEAFRQAVEEANTKLRLKKEAGNYRAVSY